MYSNNEKYEYFIVIIVFKYYLLYSIIISLCLFYSIIIICFFFYSLLSLLSFSSFIISNILHNKHLTSNILFMNSCYCNNKYTFQNIHNKQINNMNLILFFICYYSYSFSYY
ncbi:hypothetical protein EDI_227960 [Entamoeba dispar SAW760]|uniref:Uncharacterized protein n=1 Tax=Entamoeba dispar (strain ATCC PRA-260 / SAW760) TaxID=370354 RepID=B0EQA3_ENTDS|nr:uncharacterized protein EDI_227960 [Entamoeba dispar SAW760]EDR23294.1 hypothetical protein EDI_227960 [Entamoeba dispar SAW760]|eukprot:EDR23294.1 hypothetical protein EDI_227960 [Entamoeba dispar SAW760]